MVAFNDLCVIPTVANSCRGNSHLSFDQNSHCFELIDPIKIPSYCCSGIKKADGTTDKSVLVVCLEAFDDPSMEGLDVRSEVGGEELNPNVRESLFGQCVTSKVVEPK